MVGAGLMEGADPGADRVDVAEREQRVEQAVAAATRQVLLGEAQPQPVVGVVGQREVVGQGGAGGGAGPVQVGVQDDAQFGRQQPVRARGRRGPGATCSTVYEVRVRAARPFGGEPQHLRPEGGQYPLLGRHRHGRGVQFAEVLDHLRVRPGVPRGHRRVADAEPEDEPVVRPRRPARQTLLATSAALSCQMLRMPVATVIREVAVDQRHRPVDAGRAAQPDRAVAQFLQLGGGFPVLALDLGVGAAQQRGSRRRPGRGGGTCARVMPGQPVGPASRYAARCRIDPRPSPERPRSAPPALPAPDPHGRAGKDAAADLAQADPAAVRARRRRRDHHLVAVLQEGPPGAVGQRQRRLAVPGQLDQRAPGVRLAAR